MRRVRIRKWIKRIILICVTFGVFFVLVISAFLGGALYNKVNALKQGTNNLSVLTPVPAPTMIPFDGQDVLRAINLYRKSLGLTGLTVDDGLCNDIVQRYLDISNPKNADTAHFGFKEWIAKNVHGPWPDIQEVYTQGNSIDQVMKQWEGSPSHNDALINPRAVNICTYALNGYAIAEFGLN